MTLAYLNRNMCNALRSKYGLCSCDGVDAIKYAVFQNVSVALCDGGAENDGHENDGPSKLQGMKLQNMKLQNMTEKYIQKQSIHGF